MVNKRALSFGQKGLLLILAVVVFSLWFLGSSVSTAFGQNDTPLRDILVADFNSFRLIRVNSVTGTQSVVSSGGNFRQLSDVAIETDGEILVTNDGSPGTDSVIRVDPVTGAQTVVSSGGNFVVPSGIAIETSGNILVSDARTPAVIRVDPVSGAQTILSSGDNFVGPHSIAIEANGDILVTDFNAHAVIRVDPVSGAQTILSSGDNFILPRGIAIEANGDILVADDGAAAIIRVDPVTGAQNVVSSGGNFVRLYGIAVEDNGDILVSDFGADAIIRVDPGTGTQSVLSSGGNFVNPNGIALETAENQPPEAICQDVTVPTEYGLCSADASVDDGSFDPDGDPITLDQEPEGPYVFGETDVTLTVTDDKGASDTCDAMVTVVDEEAPEITSLSAIPNALWPPNHKMVPVIVEVDATDNCDPEPVCEIISVESNEPVNGSGDGNTPSDWAITSDLTVNLRAERSGTGSGRIYTVTVECTDQYENGSTDNVTVTVSHDKGKRNNQNNKKK